MTGFRRQKNLKEYLIRAIIPNPLAERPERNMKGMTKFGMQCSACHYIKEGRSIKFNQSTLNIYRIFHCSNYNIIYLIECNRAIADSATLVKAKDHSETNLPIIGDMLSTITLTQPLGATLLYLDTVCPI